MVCFHPLQSRQQSAVVCSGIFRVRPECCLLEPFPAREPGCLLGAFQAPAFHQCFYFSSSKAISSAGVLQSIKGQKRKSTRAGGFYSQPPSCGEQHLIASQSRTGIHRLLFPFPLHIPVLKWGQPYPSLICLAPSLKLAACMHLLFHGL